MNAQGRSDLAKGLVSALTPTANLKAIEGMITTLVGGDAGLPGVVVAQTEGGPKLVLGLVPRYPFPRVLPSEEKLAYYRECAADPRLALVRREGRVWIGFVGEEPKDHAALVSERRWLGHGGKGYALLDTYGDWVFTHNLSADEFVPVEFTHLFDGVPATHEAVHELSEAEERAHWRRSFDPFADREAA